MTPAWRRRPDPSSLADRRKGAEFYGAHLWSEADDRARRHGDAAGSHPPTQKETPVTALARKGGVVASIILILIGVGAMVAGAAGREKVQNDLAREQIVGTPDSSIPGQKVDTGGEAKAFAAVIRKHTLEATGGQTYSQMGRFLDESGKPTGDEAAAAKDPKTGEPVENGLRNMWVTSTALSTSLNTAYFAESVATFAIVMGIALLLTGIGFLVLTARVLWPVAGKARSPRASALPTTG